MATRAADLVQSAAQRYGARAIRQLLPQVANSIEVRTAFSPPVTLRPADFIDGTGTAEGPAQRLSRFVRPTIIVIGTATGRQVLAPYGQSSATEWKRNLTLLAFAGFAAGAVFSLGVFGVGRRAERRKLRFRS